MLLSVTPLSNQRRASPTDAPTTTGNLTAEELGRLRLKNSPFKVKEQNANPKSRDEQSSPSSKSE